MAEIGHGGKPIVERIMEPGGCRKDQESYPNSRIRSQLPIEVIGLTYGYFSPVEGFMDQSRRGLSLART